MEWDVINDDIRQSIDQLDAILRQYDSGTIDGLTDAEPRERQRKLADQQRHSLDGHIDVSERSERTHHKEDNGAERFEAGDRHSIADPGGLDWDAKKRERDVITSNSSSVTSPQTNAATASRNQVQVQGITQDSSSDHVSEMSGAMMAHVAPGMAHVALARRGMAPHGDQGQYVGANGNVYRADSLSRLPPPPEDLLYDEVHCPGSGWDSIYDYPSYPPQSVFPHGEVAPPPGGQGTNQQCDSRKRPPALPKRSPSTRLSTASSVSDSPSSPNSQMTSPRFSRCSSTSDSYDNRHSQDHSHGHPDVYCNAHDQRSPGHYQRSYSVPNAHDVKGHQGQGHQGHQPLHAQTSLPQHYQQHQHPGAQIGHTGHQGHQAHQGHPGQHAHAHHGQPPAQHAHHVPQHAVPPDRHPSHVPQHSVSPDRHPHPHPPHPGQSPAHQQSPGPESNGVSEKSKFFEQKMDEEAVVLRLKKGNLVDSGEPRPPSFTPPPPPSSTNSRWQGSPGQGPAPPSVTAKRSPVHQRLNQGPGRRMSEQIPQTGSPEMGRRSSETSLPPRASSFRGMPSQPMAPKVTSPTSPPPVTSKPVGRSNSTGTEQSRPSPIGEEVQHCVKPSMFRNAVAPPQVHDQKQQRSQSITSPIAENEPREISPAKSSDVIENEGLLKPSKIKSIIGGQGKPKQKLHHQQSAPVSSHPPHQPQVAPQAHSHHAAHHHQHHAPQAPHIPHAPQVPPPQPPTSTFSPRQKSTPVAIPSVPKVPVIPIRTGRTPPEQQIATSPPRKNSADLVGEVSTFKLRKKKEESKKLPAGAVKPKGPGNLIHSEIVNNLKGGVKLKRRSDGPVIPEIHGDAEGENGYYYDDEVAAMVDIDDLPPPPPDFGDEYYHNHYQQQQQHDHYNQQLQQQQHDYYVQQQQQQEMYSQHNVQSSQQQQYSPNGKQQGLAMALHEQSPPPSTNGRKNSDEDLDLSHIPGYVPIPENCPHWKIGMLEKKNKDAYEKYMRDLEVRALEDARWQDVPAWKRDLMNKKEQKKKEEMAPTEDERRRMDEEMARLGNMPEWKRQIILKKRQDIM